MKERLKEAADAYNEAPQRLLDAIVEASKGGATNQEIAEEIYFTYHPDYIGKLITKAVGPRTGGRRPGRKRPRQTATSSPSKPEKSERPQDG